jgi:hypothetical protein
VASPEPDLDPARRLIVERNLVRAAFEHLTVDAFMSLPFEALAPTKALLKRFFSPEPWTLADEEALADTVGPGEGRWQRALDPELSLEYGWGEDGRFRIRVTGPASGRSPSSSSDFLAASFDGPVVPEATPNPRTIRFHVGALPAGRARWYESGAAVSDDPGVARLFSEFEEVANVLVGPDFVAVGLHRPGDWERLLLPILAVVTEEFASVEPDGEADPDDGVVRQTGGPARETAASASGRGRDRRLGRLEEAWRELGSLRPGHPTDLAVLAAAAQGDDPFRRQVAANLLREADPAVAKSQWERLLHDPARSVRRATVDAIVDVGREELRPLLERALDDKDPWIRWKALRGLVELGPAASRQVIQSRAGDPDFRVRLEVAAALRR